VQHQNIPKVQAEMTSKRAILIAGPTASGKSSIAVQVAGALEGVVINADSMQVYGDLEILTARPGPAELEAVPHALYGVRSGAEVFSVADWLSLAKREADKAWKTGKVPVFTGGTGLYFKALLGGLVDVPEIPESIRDKLQERLDQAGPELLYKELEAKDPKTAQRLKPRDRQRIIRALEVIEATGKPLSRWLEEENENPFRGVEFLKFCLLAEPGDLNRKIRTRFDNMIEKGALKEAGDFAAQRIDLARPITKALGLRPLLRHLKGEIPLAEAIDLAVIETRQYAKRQRTWFRNQFTDWAFIEATPGAVEKILSLAKRGTED